MRTFFYCIGQGLANTRSNILFSIASVATVSACIFLFCMFFSIIANVRSIVYTAETTVGITVFFDESADDAAKESVKQAIMDRGGVKEIVYTSAEEAWEEFKTEYFGEDAEELSEAYADDNPLADSDSYEIFLNDIEDQEAMAEYIAGLPGVRQVNYANTVVSVLKSLNRVVSILSIVIIGVLVAVSVFLISNTISVAAAFRKRENEIMRLIGATDFMIRAPFVVEGLLIGLLGALIPLAAVYYIYGRVMEYFTAWLSGLGTGFELMGLVPLDIIFPYLAGCGLLFGAGIGFIVSFFTIRKHLRV